MLVSPVGEILTITNYWSIAMGKIERVVGTDYLGFSENGDYLITESAGRSKHSTILWRCVCKYCGLEKTYTTGVLRSEVIKCKCQAEKFVGREINKVKVVNEFRKVSNGRSVIMFSCVCRCGKEFITAKSHLLSGHTQSCGCYARQRTSEARATHRLSKHPLYVVWHDMQLRCYHKSHKNSEMYGSKNITVCDEWLQDVVGFVNWGINNGWRKGLQLDRIDNSKGYYPDNCRFVTPKENIHNSDIQRRNKLGVAGVWYEKSRNKFQAYINGLDVAENNKRVHLGRFNTLQEAVEARNNYIREHNLPHRIQTLGERNT